MRAAGSKSRCYPGLAWDELAQIERIVAKLEGFPDARA
jgi:hypothetical protein